MPYLGGKYEANVRASATVSAIGCSASGKITAEGQVKFTDYVEGNLRGEGGVEFQSNGQKGNCEYEFDNAFLGIGGGAAGDIPFAKIPGLGKIDAAAGIRLEGQAGLNFRWLQGSDFPSWPQKVDGSLRVGVGGFGKTKTNLGWLGNADVLIRVVGSASWTIHSPSNWEFKGFSVSVLARAEVKVTNPITGKEYKKFKEFTFTWNSSGAGSDALSLLGGSIDTTQIQALAADSPDNITFGIELLDAVGTLNDYSTDTFQVVTQDLLDDTPPTIATAPDGTLYGLWSNRNGVNVHRYDAETDVWSFVGRVGDDSGLATRDARLTFDEAGQGIIVFAGQDYSHLSETSTAEEIDASFAVGSDLYYATFDPTTDSFSDDLPLFSLSGDDSSVSLLSVGGGDIIAVWVHTDSDRSASVYSSRYNASTGTWESGTAIANTVAIGSRPAVSILGGVPTVIWSQDDSALLDDQFNTSSTSKLMTSKLVDGFWTSPNAFTFSAAVNTTRLATTSNGDQAQIYTTPTGELNVITRMANSDDWSQPTQLSLAGEVAIDTAAVAYDAAGQTIAIWIEVVHNDVGQPVSSSVNYASQAATSGQWSQPQRLAVSAGEAGQLQLISLSDCGWVVAWTENTAASDAVLRTATWTVATRTFDAASTRSTGVVPGSVSVGQVGGDTVLVWQRTGAETALDRGLTYSIHSSAGWGEAISAESFVHAEVRYRSKEVSREASRAEAFDQYQVGIAALLAKQFGGAMLMTGAGVYLRTAGILPFSPPEDCCKCKEFDERTVGSNEGCGSTTEIDRENCIRITTYKPCIRRPVDPNDILGPDGFGEERWVSSLTPLSYRIRFENSADAGAAARMVDVTQVLDSDLWLPTFSLKGFGFRGYHFEIPGSPAFYSTLIDLTAELGVLVEFTAGINPASREAFWRLVAIDPATGQPPLNPDLGLLSPNDEEGNGEGYLDYSIGAMPTVTSGSRVDALARIVFDTEEPIDTPPIFNTLDALAPTSSVIVGPAPETTEFTVSWSGQDDADGSGVASYTILVAVDGGNYTVWLDETTATEAVYFGNPGSTYAFVSLAADNANNLEAFPEQADWTVTLPGGSATIGDFVWHDLNDNGLVDLNEPGLDGVTVSLFIDDGSAEGLFVASTVTSNGGNYSFTELATDVNYFLAITPPSGFVVGKPLVGDDTTLDSDFAWDGRTAVFSVANGNNLSFDAALVQTGSIGGLIWEDLDGDGIRDLAEAGLAGWTVYLDLNDNGILDPEEPRQLSGPDGQYVFENLRPGTYVVAEVLQPGYVQTFPGEAGASTTHRSYVRSGSQAELFLPALELVDDGPIAEGGLGAAGLFGSPASQLIGLDRFLTDPRFSGLGGAGTVVVIDTGIDLNHEFFGPDLDGDGVADRIIFQYDFADNDFDASDQTGHGSHVAGLIAGGDLRYPGIAPEANIIALKVFGDDGRGKFADVERALQWVIENAVAYNIDAVNLSLGDGMNWSTSIGGYGISDELAVLADLGVITVAAAGNGYGLFNSPGLAYPAADPNTISVGAVWDSNRGGPWRFGPNGTDYSTAAGRVASFSQRDSYMLDVFAPGAILTSANQYGGVSAMRGTSMAAPQVAGAAVWAQTIARHTLGRSLTTSEFRYLLRQSGTRLVDGDDENDNVFNTGSTYAGLNLVALGEAILAYDGSYTGSGYTVTDTTDPGNDPGVANGRPNRYLINLAPGQERGVVDFGNRLADADAPRVIDFSEITPAVRNHPLSSIEVTFSEPIAPDSLTVDDFTLLRGSTPIALTSATLTQINETTWQLGGLSNLTSGDGSYSLTLSGAAVSDPAGNIGEGTAERSFIVDTTAPVGTIQSLPSFQNTATFAVTVAGQDPLSGDVASGVSAYEIYSQVNGGAFSLWTTVAANNPTAWYTAESNQILGFYAIAIDAAGNREASVATREVVTRTGDVTLPVTSVSDVNTSSPSLLVQFSGSDAGGSGLSAIDLMVSVDGGTPVVVETLSTAGQTGTITGTFTYPAFQDGVEHSYRFFTVGIDGAGNREAAPDATSDVIVTAAFETPTTPQVINFRVQGGSISRSFIQTLEVMLSDSGVAAAIAASMNDPDPAAHRMSLVRLNSEEETTIDVSLASRVTYQNAALQIDFGPQGIGGNRNTSDGNGNYVLRLDLDGDTSNGQEALLTFFRLFGDTNGDRVVDNVDVQTVDASLGQAAGSVGDVNGDGVVNVLDRSLVRSRLGDSVAEQVLLSISATAPPQITGFDVQNGQTQRSFIRYLRAEISAPEVIDQLVASLANDDSSDDRIKLEKFDLDGLGVPQLIDLTARASAVDQALQIDFGTGGLPGGGSSNIADGYYKLSIDLDGDLSNGYESQLHFYRLLGDINGDGRVDDDDRTAVENTSDPEADVNGDGIVNILDRQRVIQSLNRQFNNTLPLDD